MRKNLGYKNEVAKAKFERAVPGGTIITDRSPIERAVPGGTILTERSPMAGAGVRRTFFGGVHKYSTEQPRDKNGKFTVKGGSSEPPIQPRPATSFFTLKPTKTEPLHEPVRKHGSNCGYKNMDAMKKFQKAASVWGGTK